MAKVNVPFELEPWCEGCSKMHITKSYAGFPFATEYTCSNIRFCRQVAARVRQLDKGGDADA